MKPITNIRNIIIYEDNHYIALNKPPMIATIPERCGTSKNILSMLREQHDEIRVCHRLDKGTSGVVLFAKSKEAQRNLSMQFARRQVYKEYHAVCMGQHKFEEELARASLSTLGKKVKISSSKGKKARTLFYTEKIYSGFTLVKCRPITGRTHQIRIHASSKKASLVGDIKYRGKNIFLSHIKSNYKKKKDQIELPIIQRTALHASKISFKDLDDNEISVQAEYPNDFLLLLKYLNKYCV